MFKIGDEVIYEDDEWIYEATIEEIHAPDDVILRDHTTGRLWKAHVKSLTLVKDNSWLLGGNYEL